MASKWWVCRDCGSRDFEMFMVKDELWAKIWPGYAKELKAIKNPKKRHGVLCLPCAEKRLGRKITEEDQNLPNASTWKDPGGAPDE